MNSRAHSTLFATGVGGAEAGSEGYVVIESAPCAVAFRAQDVVQVRLSNADEQEQVTDLDSALGLVKRDTSAHRVIVVRAFGEQFAVAVSGRIEMVNASALTLLELPPLLSELQNLEGLLIEGEEPCAVLLDVRRLSRLVRSLELEASAPLVQTLEPLGGASSRFDEEASRESS